MGSTFFFKNTSLCNLFPEQKKFEIVAWKSESRKKHSSPPWCNNCSAFPAVVAEGGDLIQDF